MPAKDLFRALADATEFKSKIKTNISEVILKHTLFTKSIHFKISIILNKNSYHQSLKCILNEVVFTPKVKTLETGLQWTRYQICTVIEQLYTSLNKPSTTYIYTITFVHRRP